MNEILELRGIVTDLVSSSSRQTALLESLGSISNQSLPSGAQSMSISNTSVPTRIAPQFRQARVWPPSFTSLASITMSNLMFMYLADCLDEIPYEPNIKIQQKVSQAIAIASQFYDVRLLKVKPSGRKPTESDYELWRAKANEIQSSIVSHIVSNRPKRIRARGPTGSVEGILKAWSDLKSRSM